MNLLYGLVIVVVVTATTVTAMLLVRRHAPEGSYFKDGDRAAGVFGVLATGFSLLLGFIIFLAFDAYDQSLSGGETEATIVAQQVETAQFLPPAASAKLTGDLACYARSVVGIEWDAMQNGTLGDSFNPWTVAMFRTMKSVTPKGAAQQSAYDRWMDQTTQREQARLDRVRGADGIIPLPLWIVLWAISGVIFVFMLFFADSDEGVWTQGVLMGSVSVVITLLLLLLVFFDHPHGNGIGRLKPTAMERTVQIMNSELAAIGKTVTPPCDAQGNAN